MVEAEVAAGMKELLLEGRALPGRDGHPLAPSRGSALGRFREGDVDLVLMDSGGDALAAAVDLLACCSVVVERFVAGYSADVTFSLYLFFLNIILSLYLSAIYLKKIYIYSCFSSKIL